VIGDQRGSIKRSYRVREPEHSPRCCRQAEFDLGGQLDLERAHRGPDVGHALRGGVVKGHAAQRVAQPQVERPRDDRSALVQPFLDARDRVQRVVAAALLPCLHKPVHLDLQNAPDRLRGGGLLRTTELLNERLRRSCDGARGGAAEKALLHGLACCQAGEPHTMYLDESGAGSARSLGEPSGMEGSQGGSVKAGKSYHGSVGDREDDRPDHG
jgi:hypothetical protein